MTEQILPGLYKLEIPIPNNPLKALNCYVVAAAERSLIIDTGLNRPEALTAMHQGLQELNIDLTRTDFFITHLHADHSGMLHALRTPTSHICASANDAAAINNMTNPSIWKAMESFACANGFPPEDAPIAISRHPGFKHGSQGELAFTILSEGHTLTIGDYRFSVIATPGHTRGHLCLYEPEKKVLFSGDHILRDITPNISLWSDDYDPLGQYLASLDKIDAYKVDLVLPGHRRLFADCHTRIAELKDHHHRRCEEVMSILADGPLTSYAVASRMTWDLRGTWPEFPPPQKWFAAGEATAHLRYLETCGRVIRTTENNQTIYAPA